MMRSVVLYCPALERDIRPLRDQVPGLLVYDGLALEDGREACMQGHQDIVLDAEDEGADRVFVLEDDCQFTEHFDFHRWSADVEWARQEGFDLLVGGCVQTYDPRIVRSAGGVILEVSRFHSSHCVAYLDTSYDMVSRAYVPFDVSLGELGCRVAVTWPFVAVQRPGYSGILKKQVDYSARYRAHEEFLGRTLGLAARRA